MRVRERCLGGGVSRRLRLANHTTKAASDMPRDEVSVLHCCGSHSGPHVQLWLKQGRLAVASDGLRGMTKTGVVQCGPSLGGRSV